MVSGGILAAHLQRVTDAIVALLWEKEKASGTAINEDNFDIPEAYLIFLQMQHEGHVEYWQGGWADQPYCLSLEFEQVDRAKNEIADLKRLNAQAQADWDNTGGSRRI